MPHSPSRPCRKPGCHNLTRNRNGFCDVHQNYDKKKYDKRRLSAQERGYDYKWRKDRNAYTREHPYCERCYANGIIKPMYCVHHKDRNPRNNEWENFESLCRNCHDIEHKDEKFGNDQRVRVMQ